MALGAASVSVISSFKAQSQKHLGLEVRLSWPLDMNAQHVQMGCVEQDDRWRVSLVNAYASGEMPDR